MRKNWHNFIGRKNGETRATLSGEQLESWLKDTNHKVVCVFCGKQYSPNTAVCTDCNEYKGIEPAIDGWNY